MDSLVFFKPNWMSLTKPHPLWSTAGSSPSKVAMATIQAQMISGRFRTEQLCSNWSKNKAGICLLSPACSMVIEDLPHILSLCPTLQPTRDKLRCYSRKYCRQFCPEVSELVLSMCDQTSSLFCQFLLDCSTLPAVVTAVQLHGKELLSHIFQIPRTWIYILHKERMKLLGRWNPV